MTDDLTARIAARLDERETLAKAATPGPWRTWGDNLDAFVEQAEGVGHLVADLPLCPEHPGWRHPDGALIALHDPVWVLRDVAAKRKVLREHTECPCGDYDGPKGHCSAHIRTPWPCDEILSLAESEGIEP